MQAVHVEALVPADQLLKGVEQLGTAELRQFVSEVLSVQARRNAPSLPQPEAALFRRINASLPESVRDRYRLLRGRRDAYTLTPEEHAELVSISDRVEEMDADRVAALAELARIRGKTLDAIMVDLGIRAPNHA